VRGGEGRVGGGRRGGEEERETKIAATDSREAAKGGARREARGVFDGSQALAQVPLPAHPPLVYLPNFFCSEYPSGCNHLPALNKLTQNDSLKKRAMQPPSCPKKIKRYFEELKWLLFKKK
jgi:hypothetical protein